MIVRIWSRLFETLLWYCLSPQTALRLSGVIKIKLLRSFSNVIADNHNFNGELRELNELFRSLVTDVWMTFGMAFWRRCSTVLSVGRISR